MEAGDEIVTFGWGEAKGGALAQPLQGTPCHRCRGSRSRAAASSPGLCSSVATDDALPPSRALSTTSGSASTRARVSRAARPVGRHELSHLPGRELLIRDRFDQKLALLPVGARQRDQVLHRRVRGDLAAKYALLDRLRQVPYQGQPPAHPAQAPIEPPRQLLERQREAHVQLAQPQPLLECASPPRQRASAGQAEAPRPPPRPSRRPGPHRTRDAASPGPACSRPRRRSDRPPPTPPPRSASAVRALPETKAASAPAPGTASAGARNGGSVGGARGPCVHSACWTLILLRGAAAQNDAVSRAGEGGSQRRMS